MPRLSQLDPYNGFKNDRERRLALNVRVLSYSVVAVVAMITTPVRPMEILQWLMRLFP